MSFGNYILTSGMNEQYILLGLVKVYTQQLNKVFEGHGKFIVLSIPTTKNNALGLDISMADIIQNNDGTITINVFFIDSKSSTNVSTKNGPALSNITKCACIKYRIKESENVEDALIYIKRHLDGLPPKLRQIEHELIDISDELNGLLPQLIDKHNTPLLFQMSHQNIHTLITSFLTYFGGLPSFAKDSFDINSLTPDEPHSVGAFLRFAYDGLLEYLATIVGKDDAQEKFVVGELFRELTYVIRALTKDVDGIVDLVLLDPQAVSPIFYTDSLIPTTTEQYKQLKSILIS